MISKGTAGYWSTGITVRQNHDGGWAASLDFLDDGFCDDDAATASVSTEGVLRTRYFVDDGEQVSGLSVAIDTLLVDAGRLGITFQGAMDGPPVLYYEGDGESKDWPPPDGWRALLGAEAARIGWQAYGTAPADTPKEQP